MKSLLVLISFLTLLSCHSSAGPPVEIGTVKYEASLEAALAQAKKSNKPIFLLFQEVPG